MKDIIIKILYLFGAQCKVYNWEAKKVVKIFSKNQNKFSNWKLRKNVVLFKQTKSCLRHGNAFIKLNKLCVK